MENVTLNLVYNELLQIHKELHVLRQAVIPEEEIPEDERRELRAIAKEMEAGKETSWRKPERR